MFIGYMSPMNILGNWPHPAPWSRDPYIPRLTEEHIPICFSVSRRIYWVDIYRTLYIGLIYIGRLADGYIGLIYIGPYIYQPNTSVG
jgi:hypothetical protein